MEQKILFTAPDGGQIKLEQTPAGPAVDFEVLKPIDLRKTHGLKVTVKHLQSMVDNYDPDFETAALNFDHQYSGPAHGLATNLWMEGDRLWARFENLSTEAVEGIKSGRWPRRNPEITLAHDQTGEPYYEGLALLGSARPAVPGLKGARLLMNRPVFVIDLSDESAGAESAAPLETPESGEKENDMAKKDEAKGEQPAPATETPPANNETPAPAEPATVAPETVAAPVADLSAERSQLAEMTARLEAEVTKARAATLAARRLTSAATVKADLDKLGSRVTPAQRREIEPLLVELHADEHPLTVKLAAADGKVSEVKLYERILAAHAASPEHVVLGAVDLAAADPKETVDARSNDERTFHRSANLSDERFSELQRKYPTAFTTQIH